MENVLSKKVLCLYTIYNFLKTSNYIGYLIAIILKTKKISVTRCKSEINFL